MASATDVVNTLHERIVAFAEKASGDDITADQAKSYAGAAKELSEAAAWLKKPDQSH